MDLDEDNEQNIKDFNNIKIPLYLGKQNLTLRSNLWASLTRMQEHILDDCCCKYCEQTFTNRTEELGHKKYMCKQYNITFSHSVNLH